MSEEQFSSNVLSRRQFVGAFAALGVVWLTAAEACAKDPLNQPTGKLVHFTPEQGEAVNAIVGRIIPDGNSPGAREAGALYFIDNVLTTYAKDQVPLFNAGLADLEKSTKAKHGNSATFASLNEDEQDELLRAIEKTPFFGAMRFATLGGFLALPKYGGNKDYVGWKFIGQDNVMEQKPPFGWYDAPENQQALLGKVL